MARYSDRWCRANPAAEAQMVADHHSSPAESHFFAACSVSRDYRAVAFHGDHGPGGHVGVLWKRLNTFDLYCWCFGGRGTMVNRRNFAVKGFTSFCRGTSYSFITFGCNPLPRPTTPSPRTA